uniref:NR LBD domain-containing protein n=1 Tax=Acrobeloides nanus TaxID=290746 RepID=A0A914EG87_9BILA
MFVLERRYTCERVFDTCDIAFYWYRTFVTCADYANLIPQFRELSKEDQCQLFRLNFATLSWCIYIELIDFGITLLKGYPFGNGSYAPWLSDDIEEFLKKHNTPTRLFKVKKQAMEHYKDFIINLLKFIKNLSLDEKEISLFKMLSLFQQEEQLTSQGYIQILASLAHGERHAPYDDYIR